MISLSSHFLLFAQIFTISLIISISGYLLKSFLFNTNDKYDFEENGLFGFVFIGFLALIVNFLIPLNILVNDLLLLSIFLLSLKFKFFNQNIVKLIIKILIVTFIAYIFLIYSDNNRPDAFLYHLPYSKIINEQKIIFGLSNLHFRFGHISIFQYISSFFVNSIFSIKGLVIPISLVPSFFFIYCLKKFNNQFENLSTRLNAYIIFLILIISIYSFSRYSGWGNDAQAHIFYFLIIIYFLDFRLDKDNLNLFYKISIFCIFTFLIKPFYLLALLFPLIFFIYKNNKLKIIFSKTSFFLILLFSFWLLKNFIITSCFIYPLDITCIKNTSWYSSNTINVSNSGEAWAKDWINSEDLSISHDKFNSDFNWIKVWSKNHLKIIIEKISPVLIFIIMNICLFYFAKCLKNKPENKKNDNFFILLIFLNFLGFFIWFLKFPLYRYGLSYIYSFFIFIFYFIFIRFIDLNRVFKFKKFFILIIVISFLGSFIKNIVRIYNSNNISIYPSVFVNNTNPDPIEYLNNDNEFIHYITSNNTLCGYLKSPCSHLKNKDIFKKKNYGYIIYVDKKN
jgi:hypothetical protein